MPCPSCGGTNLEFKYKMTYGHGDSGFECGRIFCNDCTTSKGNLHDWGSPTERHREKAIDIWNNRNYE